jgi:hypothetical protein
VKPEERPRYDFFIRVHNVLHHTDASKYKDVAGGAARLEFDAGGPDGAKRLIGVHVPQARGVEIDGVALAPVPGEHYKAGWCGSVNCPCAKPGRVCHEWMGLEEEKDEWCPRCGWHRDYHPNLKPVTKTPAWEKLAALIGDMACAAQTRGDYDGQFREFQQRLVDVAIELGKYPDG